MTTIPSTTTAATTASTPVSSSQNSGSELTPTAATAATAATAISVENLRFTYPSADKPALDGISFQTQPGQMVALLGPNGSGKSTLFKLLTGMVRLSVETGRIQLMAHELPEQTQQARSAIGVVFQSPSLDGELTVLENLLCQAKLHGMAKAQALEVATHYAQQFGVDDRFEDKAKTLSGGLKRRVELAKALLHGPQLLLMDEPSTGLDPTARRQLWEQVNTLREQTGLSVLVTTHLMDEAERCDHVVLMDQGKLIAQGTPGTLRATLPGQVLRIVVDVADSAQTIATDIQTLFENNQSPWPQGAEPKAHAGVITCGADDAAHRVPVIHEHFAEQIREISLGHATLEDVFIHLTGRSLADDDVMDSN